MHQALLPFHFKYRYHQIKRQINITVQIYARDQLFYKSEKPQIVVPFQQGQHIELAGDRNCVDDLNFAILGNPPRNISLALGSH
jgi:uncharacterized lipoprotein YbaY